jgi:hypothetical protein
MSFDNIKIDPTSTDAPQEQLRRACKDADVALEILTAATCDGQYETTVNIDGRLCGTVFSASSPASRMQACLVAICTINSIQYASKTSIGREAARRLFSVHIHDVAYAFLIRLKRATIPLPICASPDLAIKSLAQWTASVGMTPIKYASLQLDPLECPAVTTTVFSCGLTLASATCPNLPMAEQTAMLNAIMTLHTWGVILRAEGTSHYIAGMQFQSFGYPSQYFATAISPDAICEIMATSRSIVIGVAPATLAVVGVLLSFDAVCRLAAAAGVGGNWRAWTVYTPNDIARGELFAEIASFDPRSPATMWGDNRPVVVAMYL